MFNFFLTFITDLFDEIISNLSVKKIAPPKPKRRGGAFDMGI